MVKAQLIIARQLISFGGQLHEVTLQSSTFVLDADASDDSGNTGQATKELSIID